MVKTNVSPAGSIAGYSFKVWLARNLETFKLLGSALSGLATFYLSKVPEPWTAIVGVAATVVAKLILDAIHFYVKDVEVQ